jgi:hypothetical protein
MIITKDQHHKSLLGTTLLCLLVITLFFQVTQVQAADTLIDIFFLPHQPALAIVSEVEKVAAEFDSIVIKKYSFEDPATAKLLKEYNLTDHTPVAIFINGQNTFTVEGKKISLRNFTKGNAFVPMFAGEWDYSDLRFILQEINGAK